MNYENITSGDIAGILRIGDPHALKELYDAAYRVKLREVGNVVHFRGIVEMSNVCAKNCYYCGIRRGNSKVSRYDIPDEEILECGALAYEQGYGSIVLQAGERSGREYVDRIERLVAALKSRSNGELGITLSLGEQTADTYRRWFEAGAHRYLLRIETSSPALYAKLHPADHSYAARLKCSRISGRRVTRSGRAS
jgi:biotin synthase